MSITCALFRTPRRQDESLRCTEAIQTAAHPSWKGRSASCMEAVGMGESRGEAKAKSTGDLPSCEARPGIRSRSTAACASDEEESIRLTVGSQQNWLMGKERRGIGGRGLSGRVRRRWQGSGSRRPVALWSSRRALRRIARPRASMRWHAAGS